MKRNFTLLPGLLLLALLHCSLYRIHAQDGAYDPSFGTNGKVWDPPAAYPTHYPQAVTPRVLVLPDGRILHLSTTAGGTKFTRYLPEGQVDAGFGSSGSIDIPAASGLTSIRDAALLSNGRFVVAGAMMENGAVAFGVARYLADGTPDASFGHSGRIAMPVPGNGGAYSMALQPDGRILLAGPATEGGEPVFATVRLLPNGSPDNSFGGDGLVITNFNPGNETAKAVAVQLDGKIVVAGDVRNQVLRFGMPVYQQDAGVVRYLPDGTLDTGFDTDGKASIITESVVDEVAGVAQQPDGKLVVGGSHYVEGDPDQTALFAQRFLPDGMPDAAFNGGHRSVPIIGQVKGTDLGIQADGKILLAGFQVYGTQAVNPGFRGLVVARLLPGGSPDGSLAGNGILYRSYMGESSPFETQSLEFGNALASQGNQLILGAYAQYPIYNGPTKALLMRLNNSSPLIAEDPQYYYPDYDRDGYGSGGTSAAVLAYAPPSAQFATRQGDCDEANPAINPDATEVTDGVDNDCDGTVDEGSVNNCNYIPIPISARIEAESYCRMSGVQTQPTSDSGGGQNVGYIDYGDWMEYNIGIGSEGTYTIKFRLAATSGNARFQVRSNGFLLATVAVPNTGGFQTYTTHSIQVTLQAGSQTIQLQSSGGAYWNINWLEFSRSTNPEPAPEYVTIPAKIEAEAYTDMSGVQKETTTDAGGGQNLGYIDYGDWMEYKINVPAAGDYYINLRLATTSSNAQLRIRAGNTELGYAGLPNTGGFQSWQTYSIRIPLAAGQQTIRITSSGGAYWNLNWLSFSRMDATTFAGKSVDDQVSIDNSSKAVSVFPNPVQSNFTLKVDNLLKGQVAVQIAGANGAVLQTFALNKAAAGVQAYNLQLQNLPKGVYTLQVQMKGWKASKTIIKQ